MGGRHRACPWRRRRGRSFGRLSTSLHAAWNAGDDEVHVLVDFRPALRTETAFETLAGLARDGKTNKVGAPRNPLRLALVLRHFEDEIYISSGLRWPFRG